MKRITRRVQALNQRAAELTASAAQIPQRVAELREVAQATTNELRSLKSGIQINVPDLLVRREDELGIALAEVAAHAPVFAEAGFILDGLDLEISPIQQIIVQLLNHREVETLHIHPLIQRHQQHKHVRAILSAIVKAKSVVSTIAIEGLDYSKLSVAIGPVPTIRLCWREGAEDGETVTAAQPEAKTSTRPATPTRATSFFDTPPALPPLSNRSSARQSRGARSAAMPEADESASTPPPPDASAQTEKVAPPKQSEPRSVPEDPLARFKVMPLKR